MAEGTGDHSAHSYSMRAARGVAPGPIPSYLSLLRQERLNRDARTLESAVFSSQHAGGTDSQRGQKRTSQVLAFVQFFLVAWRLFALVGNDSLGRHLPDLQARPSPRLLLRHEPLSFMPRHGFSLRLKAKTMPNESTVATH
jgi:hypothetical protein